MGVRSKANEVPHRGGGGSGSPYESNLTYLLTYSLTYLLTVREQSFCHRTPRPSLPPTSPRSLRNAQEAPRTSSDPTVNEGGRMGGGGGRHACMREWNACMRACGDPHGGTTLEPGRTLEPSPQQATARAHMGMHASARDHACLCTWARVVHVHGCACPCALSAAIGWRRPDGVTCTCVVHVHVHAHVRSLRRSDGGGRMVSSK